MPPCLVRRLDVEEWEKQDAEASLSYLDANAHYDAARAARETCTPEHEQQVVFAVENRDHLLKTKGITGLSASELHQRARDIPDLSRELKLYMGLDTVPRESTAMEQLTEELNPSQLYKSLTMSGSDRRLKTYILTPKPDTNQVFFLPKHAVTRLFDLYCFYMEKKNVSQQPSCRQDFIKLFDKLKPAAIPFGVASVTHHVCFEAIDKLSEGRLRQLCLSAVSDMAAGTDKKLSFIHRAPDTSKDVRLSAATASLDKLEIVTHEEDYEQPENTPIEVAWPHLTTSDHASFVALSGRGSTLYGRKQRTQANMSAHVAAKELHERADYLRRDAVGSRSLQELAISPAYSMQSATPSWFRCQGRCGSIRPTRCLDPTTLSTCRLCTGNRDSGSDLFRYYCRKCNSDKSMSDFIDHRQDLHKQFFPNTFCRDCNCSG